MSSGLQPLSAARREPQFWIWLGPWLALPLLLLPQEALSPLGRMVLADPARVAAVCGVAVLLLARGAVPFYFYVLVGFQVSVFAAGGGTSWLEALWIALGLLQGFAIQSLSFYFFRTGWPAALFFYAAALLEFYGHFNRAGELGWSLSPLFMDDVNWLVLLQCVPILFSLLLLSKRTQ